MKDWHKQILVYLAGRKTHASPENIKQHLKKNGISKSHTAITTACKESLSDILIRHDQSLYDDNGVVKRKRFQYSLKNDITSLNHIVKSLDNPDLQRKFMESAYFHNWIPKLSHQFNQVISTYETLNDAGLEAIEQMSAQNLRKHGVESGMELCTKLVTDREFKDTYDFKRHTLAAMDIFNNPKVNQTGEMALNDDEVKRLESSLKHNWLALKYVVSFLLADPLMQRQMYVNMIEDSKNVLTLTDGDWTRFFNQLDQLNFNYGFLFD